MPNAKGRYTKTEVLGVLEQVVEEFGSDYVYKNSTCEYVVKNVPSCIAGHVLQRLDLLDQSLVKDNVSMLEADQCYGLTDAARRALGRAQNVQDGTNYCEVGKQRGTWGEALHAAKSEKFFSEWENA